MKGICVNVHNDTRLLCITGTQTAQSWYTILHKACVHPPLHGQSLPIISLVNISPLQASLDKARSWIRELQRQADPSIIIALCGNKTDLSSRRQVTAEEAQKYAEEEGLMWCEASAKTGEGVQDVFMAIAKKLPLSAPQSQKGAAAARAGGAGRGGGVDLSKQTSAPDGCNC
jgi:GTPase SAR1 family protein